MTIPRGTLTITIAHEHRTRYDHARGSGTSPRSEFASRRLCMSMADAAVSVLVIVGLVAGRQFGWVWMDPLMGLVATVVILSLVMDTYPFSLAMSFSMFVPIPHWREKIASRLEQGSDRVSDLHLWRLGPGHLAAVISLVTHNPHAPERYKRRLSGLKGLSHVTIEVVPCPGERH